MVHSIDILHINFFNHLIIFWPPKSNFWLCHYEKVPIECKSAYLSKMWLLKNEKAQLFGFLKCIRGINTCDNVAQWRVINTKSNVSLLNYI